MVGSTTVSESIVKDVAFFLTVQIYIVNLLYKTVYLPDCKNIYSESFVQDIVCLPDCINIYSKSSMFYLTINIYSVISVQDIVVYLTVYSPH